MPSHFNKRLKGLNFLIPFYDIAVGCLLLTNMFASIDKGKEIIFNSIIIIGKRDGTP